MPIHKIESHVVVPVSLLDEIASEYEFTKIRKILELIDDSKDYRIDEWEECDYGVRQIPVDLDAFALSLYKCMNSGDTNE